MITMMITSISVIKSSRCVGRLFTDVASNERVKVLLFCFVSNNLIGCLFVCLFSYLFCSSVVRAFTHGAMGYLIDHSWWTH